MKRIVWNKRQRAVADLIADGHTIEETSQLSGVPMSTIFRWRTHPDFISETYNLAHMIGLAHRAERLMEAKREYRHTKPTTKDRLEWLKYIQSETDGVRLDLAPILESYSSLAGSGQDGTDLEDEE